MVRELHPVYAIVLKKLNSKQKDRYFVVVDRYVVGQTYISSIGYWSEKYPETKDIVDKGTLEEVFIPWTSIDCVRSLVYRPKY